MTRVEQSQRRGAHDKQVRDRQLLQRRIQRDLFEDHATIEGPMFPPDPETELRAIWTAQGVPETRQNELIADVTAKAQPGAQVGPFTIGGLPRPHPLDGWDRRGGSWRG